MNKLSKSAERDRIEKEKRLQGFDKLKSRAYKMYHHYFLDVIRGEFLNITLSVIEMFKEANGDETTELTEMKRCDKKSMDCLFVFIDENFHLLEPYFEMYLAQNGIPISAFTKSKQRLLQMNAANNTIPPMSGSSDETSQVIRDDTGEENCVDFLNGSGNDFDCQNNDASGKTGSEPVVPENNFNDIIHFDQDSNNNTSQWNNDDNDEFLFW